MVRIAYSVLRNGGSVYRIRNFFNLHDYQTISSLIKVYAEQAKKLRLVTKGKILDSTNFNYNHLLWKRPSNLIH